MNIKKLEEFSYSLPFLIYVVAPLCVESTAEIQSPIYELRNISHDFQNTKYWLMTLPSGVFFFSLCISKDCGKKVKEKRIEDLSRLPKCIRNLFWELMTYKK